MVCLFYFYFIYFILFCCACCCFVNELTDSRDAYILIYVLIIQLSMFRYVFNNALSTFLLMVTSCEIVL